MAFVSVSSAAGGDLDIRSLGHALGRRKFWILLPTLAALVASAVGVNLLAPKYKSEVRILFDGRENIFLRPEADKASADRSVADVEAMSSQVQLVLSRGVALDVIRKLKLGELPEFDPVTKGVSPLKSVLAAAGLVRDPLRMTPEERILESYYDRLTAYAVDKSRVITLEFSSGDPELAARAANAVAESYLSAQQEAKQEQTRAAGQWLAGEIDTLRRKVSEAEAHAETFRGKTNLFVGTNNTNLSAQQLGELNSQLSAARGQQFDFETRARIINEMLKKGGPIEASEILNSESIRRLSEQRAILRGQLAEQSSTLLDNHPRIKELKAQIGDLDRQIRAEAERLIRSLETDARIAGARVENLAGALDRLKRQASSTNEQDVQLRALEREAKAQRDLLESYLAKFREASARDNIGSTPADARVISRAVVSNTPYFPKKLPMIVVAALGTLIVSAGFVVTGELMRLSPMVPGPAMAPMVAAALPETEASAAVAASGNPVDDVVGDLRRAGAAGARLAVFGASRNIEASLMAIALGRSLARLSRTVLIDLAFQAPNLAAISGDPAAPGLADAVRGTASFGDIVTRDRLSRLHLVAAGQVGGDAATIVASPRLKLVVEALARNYDHVVIDAGAVSDADVARIIALAPGAALVASDRTMPETVAARRQLAEAGYADVIMLNARHMQTAPRSAAA